MPLNVIFAYFWTNSKAAEKLVNEIPEVIVANPEFNVSCCDCSNEPISETPSEIELEPC